jgi:DNA (cytosine-5)-methyltransferase 1
MNYLSVCSGIEAATVAWHDMGWKPIGFSEIEKFPSQLLQHHYPHVTNYGDMTKFKEWNINEPVNLLVGGTPCQSFSVAGLRKGLEDPRGNLMLTYLGIADHFKPKWLLWENVPGVLSSNGGEDFACLLKGMAELGYGFAYRVLDAQHFGVPQRRRRVFVVGCLGDWRGAAKVLFESESLQGDITPSREERKEITAYVESSFGQYREDRIAGTTKASGGVLGGGSETFLTQAYNITFCDANGTRKDRPNGGLYVNETDTSNTLTKAGVGTNVVACDTYNGTIQGDIVTTITTTGGGVSSGPSVIENFSNTLMNGFDGYNFTSTGQVARTLSTGADYGHVPIAFNSLKVRRLTPMECERLQGFPDNYTNTPTSSDTTRYKALGNSMAVPVMKWIGQRINELQKP